MDDSRSRELIHQLIHQVNNLLGAIHAQIAAARAAGGERAARDALEVLERSAQNTEAKLAQLRAGDGFTPGAADSPP